MERIFFGKMLEPEYDISLSYTALKNFPFYFKNSSTNRFGIWCYEFSGKNALPVGFAKNYKYVDKLLPPSNHAKQVFLDSGIPESAMKVLPHGISQEFLTGTDIFKLKSDKRFKVLCSISQIHMRKNIDGTLDAWGKAFDKKDDVVLVMKVAIKKPVQNFEVDFNEAFLRFKKKYPNHAEVLIVNEFITDISSLYRACNAVLSLSFAESFLMPALEGLACNKILIVSNGGGQTDFCTKNNSLLVSGNNMFADPKMLYWQQKTNTTIFNPDSNHAAELLQEAFHNENKLLNNFPMNLVKYEKRILGIT